MGISTEVIYVIEHKKICMCSEKEDIRKSLGIINYFWWSFNKWTEPTNLKWLNPIMSPWHSFRYTSRYIFPTRWSMSPQFESSPSTSFLEILMIIGLVLIVQFVVTKITRPHANGFLFGTSWGIKFMLIIDLKIARNVKTR